MIDVSHKNNSLRYAMAEGRLRTTPEVIESVRENRVPKGNVLEVARAAGILAAKKTPEWLVFCHSLPVEWAEIGFELGKTSILVRSEVQTVWKTGVEMEAMTAASAALLNMYDMLKPLDREIEIESVRLIRKKGGKSDYDDLFDRPVKAALLRISDLAVQNLDADRTVDLSRKFLTGHGIEVISERAAEENEKDIRDKIVSLADSGNYHLLFTMGATGLGKKDRVMEVTRELVETEIPGLTEGMRVYGRDRTPYAMFSRSVAGIRNQTLIINLPGSSRGAIESLQALFPGLKHALLMMNEGKLREL